MGLDILETKPLYASSVDPMFSEFNVVEPTSIPRRQLPGYGSEDSIFKTKSYDATKTTSNAELLNPQSSTKQKIVVFIDGLPIGSTKEKDRKSFVYFPYYWFTDGGAKERAGLVYGKDKLEKTLLTVSDWSAFSSGSSDYSTNLSSFKVDTSSEKINELNIINRSDYDTLYCDIMRSIDVSNSKNMDASIADYYRDGLQKLFFQCVNLPAKYTYNETPIKTLTSLEKELPKLTASNQFLICGNSTNSYNLAQVNLYSNSDYNKLKSYADKIAGALNDRYSVVIISGKNIDSSSTMPLKSLDATISLNDPAVCICLTKKADVPKLALASNTSYMALNTARDANYTVYSQSKSWFDALSKNAGMSVGDYKYADTVPILDYVATYPIVAINVNEFSEENIIDMFKK